MTWKVLVSAPYMLPVIGDFADFFSQHDIEVTSADVIERMEEDDLLAVIADFDGIICGDDRITARVMDAAPKLKVISKWGTGIDSIDSAAAAKRGIRVCRTLDAFTNPVADSVIGYVLCFARRLPWMNTQMKQGIWDKIPGRALNECTIGVIGLGCVGSAVLDRAKAFGMNLMGNDIRDIEPDFISETGVRMVEKEKLFVAADFVCVCCDLNPMSRHLMGPPQFGKMKKTAVLINAARGPLVDQVALVYALENGEIAGAALDVFEDEPLAKDSPLLKMDNVMSAPHNSNSSPRAWSRVHLNTLDNLVDGLRAGIA